MRTSKNLNALSLRLSVATIDQPTAPVKVNTLNRAYSAFAHIWDSDLLPIQEQFYVLFVNSKLELMGWRCLHTGTTSSCDIDFKLLFGMAFGLQASGIFCAHNHPNQCLEPSAADLRITNSLDTACQIMGVDLHANMIINKNDYKDITYISKREII